MTPEDRELADMVSGELYVLMYAEATATEPREVGEIIQNYIQPALAGETEDTTLEIANLMRAVDAVIISCVPDFYMDRSAVDYVDSDSVDALTISFTEREEIEYTPADMQELAENMGIELHSKLQKAESHMTVGEVVDRFYRPMMLGLTDDSITSIGLHMEAYTLLDARAQLNDNRDMPAKDYLDLSISDRLFDEYDQLD